MHSKFVIIPLVNQLRLVTRGNLISSPTYYDLTVPDLSNLLPRAEGLTLFSLIEAPSTNFRAGLWCRSGFTRNHEVGLFQIGANVPASSGVTESKRHTEYTTLASFELVSRLQIAYGNDSGTDCETGVLSLALGVRLWGQ